MSVYNMAGGGAALNVKVVGGTSAPDNPRENTVWVNTDTPISEWVFAAAQPTMRLDGTALCGGEVWFNTAASTQAPMNLLKKNGAYLYPFACMQYVGGIWTPKTAKTYQSGAWVDWALYLYNTGNENTPVTGGWEARALPYASGGLSGAPAIARNAASMVVTTNANYGSGLAETANALDLTGFSKATARFDGSMSGGKAWLVVTAHNIASYWGGRETAKVMLLNSSESGIVDRTVELNLEAVAGTYDVAIGFQTMSYMAASLTLYELRLEY